MRDKFLLRKIIYYRNIISDYIAIDSTMISHDEETLQPLIAIHDFSDFAELPCEAFRTSRNFRM